MTTAIRPQHLQRPAYVYLRQSTPGQVHTHRESTQRQYALAERDVELAWDRSQVISQSGWFLNRCVQAEVVLLPEICRIGLRRIRVHINSPGVFDHVSDIAAIRRFRDIAHVQEDFESFCLLVDRGLKSHDIQEADSYISGCVTVTSTCVE